MNTVSVAMAVFNGEKYLREQIDSILAQLGKDDELIISYNESTDETLAIINGFQESDSRIKIFVCKRKGVIPNFENAISKCTGDIVFLSDQDDVWNINKIPDVVRVFDDKDVSLVLHDAQYVDSDLNPIDKSLFSYRGKKTGVISNIIKNRYQGCCMAFRGDLKEIILPFPSNIPMHDQWIGIMAAKFGKVKIVDEKYIFYRIHGSNASPTGVPVRDMVLNRLYVIGALLERSGKIRTHYDTR